MVDIIPEVNMSNGSFTFKKNNAGFQLIYFEMVFVWEKTSKKPFYEKSDVIG